MILPPYELAGDDRLDSPPRLLPGVCDDCADAIFDRRARAEDAIEA
jgi:hypothetical protein